MKQPGAAVARLGLALVLAACAGVHPLDTPAPTVTTATLIAQSAAIDAALRFAMSPHPEVSASLVLPRDIAATQMSLEEAEHILHGPGATLPTGYARDLPVWLVTMEGRWLDEFPREGTAAPTPKPYRQMLVILDAATGLEIEGEYQP